MWLQLPPGQVRILVDGLVPSFIIIHGMNDLDLTREMMTCMSLGEGDGKICPGDQEPGKCSIFIKEIGYNQGTKT